MHKALRPTVTGGVKHAAGPAYVGVPRRVLAGRVGHDGGGVDDEVAAGGVALPVPGGADVSRDDAQLLGGEAVHSADLGAGLAIVPSEGRADEPEGSGDEYPRGGQLI